jgi:hypothetical protein
MIEEFTVRPSDTPELADMLTDSHPRCYRHGSTDDPLVEDALARFHLSSVVVVPIVARGEFLGIVTAATAGGQPPLDFRDDTQARLAGLANQAAVALSNARLLAQERATLAELRRSEAQVKHQAAHHALTGLANRALFGDLLGSTLKRGVACRSCSSTWTTARRSTTAWGTRSATTCWRRCRPGWPRACAPATRWPASAATSSPS